jgi:RNA polymerase sigma factor (sigma-70 family)
MSPQRVTDELGHLLRELAPQVLAAVARRHGEFADAEDAVQEALIAAAAAWPADGVPSNPRGWLYQVARRRLTDQLRSDISRRNREEVVARQLAAEAAAAAPRDAPVEVAEDDSLSLLFMCCHPSLTPASAIALTLRAMGGLTTAEIAHAFLVPEATMAQRISRAKATIKSSGTDFALPTDADRAARLDNVLQVLYLMFSEGYTSSSGATLHRIELSNEAIRLARAARALMPHDGEVAGLLALMLLTDARRAARTGPSGELIPLDEQDRARWDRGMIDEGRALLAEAMPRSVAGPYLIQAAIAAVHDEAERAGDTDWPQIVALYEALRALPGKDNPMAALSLAIARSMVEGPRAGLALVDALDVPGKLRGNYRLAAVRGHLHERLGERHSAVAQFRLAAQGTLSLPERDYLMGKAARLGG